MGTRLRGRGELSNVDVFWTVPRTPGLLLARIEPENADEPDGLVYVHLQVHIGCVFFDGGVLDPPCELVPTPG